MTSADSFKIRSFDISDIPIFFLVTSPIPTSLCVFILAARPQGEFVDDGTETHFTVGEHECCIKATSGGKKKNGIVHYLLLDGEKIPASTQ